MSEMKVGLIILLTGIVVVFGVLVLLIFIIKMYSTAVSNAQSRIEQSKTTKEPKPVKVAESKPEPIEKAQTEQPDDTIPGEIIAAIAAAVDTVFGEGAVTVTSVKKAKRQNSSGRYNAWRSAGMAENTRAF
ncbi:MAG: OadG family protein [Clostridia bacterium]|nr:OadG family protein [Clostridia bacterium]